ncbi:MAG: hypothetical protein MUC92_10315 [Fimbriimonadaceae bacterium]|nr:hypothetical protein [Fimbriimonadaceae bacterium]
MGEWRGTDPAALETGGDPTIFATLRTVRLRIKADGTTDLLQGGISSRGQLSFGGTQSTLMTHTVLDQPLSHQSAELQERFRPRTLSYNSDGTITLVDFSGISSRDIVLTKWEQPADRSSRTSER